MKNCNNNYCVKESEVIYKEKLADAMNYEEYLDKVYAILDENHSSRDDESETLFQFTRMNTRRMELWNKTIVLLPEVESYFKSIDKRIDFLIITEAWCGDAAHVMPMMQKIADLNKNLSIKTVFRDEHPEIMDQYLTNGTKSIPIIVALQCIDNKYVELFKWGPKPKPMMMRLNDFKDGKLDVSKGILLKETQKWYDEDKTNTIQEELTELMKASLII